MWDALVGRDQDIELCARSAKELAVFNRRPPVLLNGRDLMLRQEAPDAAVDRLVKQDAQAR